MVWKEDGNSRGRPTHIWAQPLDDTGTKLTGEPHELLRNDAAWEGPVVEGAFVFRHGDWFYMLYAGNACCGRGCKYATGVARSKALLGPWEKDPGNPILDTNADFRGPGHGSLVAGPSGRLFFLYHSYVLPTFVFTGREMMLDEVTFNAEGWPVINGARGPSTSAPSPFGVKQLRAELTFTDEFAAESLDKSWQWPVKNKPQIELARADGGHLLLAPTERRTRDFFGAVLGRSCTSGDYVATTAVDLRGLKPGAVAGLAAVGDLENSVGISVADGTATVWQIEKAERKDLASAAVGSGPVVHLRMTATGGDRLQFAISPDAKTWTSLDATGNAGYLPPWDRSIRVAIFAGHFGARFDYVRIEPVAK